jgi:hypothetical protein
VGFQHTGGELGHFNTRGSLADFVKSAISKSELHFWSTISASYRNAHKNDTEKPAEM